ncbi:hypothetical protein pipiens_003530 [Culex pipiens pipiens]|uniref:Uncharacterized protein n=1 Tax=Culex pipiens pipiens TaxID=38569 RepID=A0ABD1CWL9_CULPP
MDFESICRLCAKEKSTLRNIAEDERNVNLVEQIRDIVRIEYEPDDGLPQQVCKACATALHRIQETLDEFRTNDQLLRNKHHVLPDGDVEIKQEELDDDEEQGEEYSVQEVKIELLETEAELSDGLEQSEEWLEDDEVCDESEALDESDTPQKRRRSRKSPRKVEKLDETEQTNEDVIMAEVEMNSPKRRRGRRPAGDKEGGRRRRKPAEDDPNRPKMNDYKCYICMSESLGSALNLLDHLNTHTDRLPYTCEICVQETIELKQVRSLNIHLKMHQQPVKCSYCDRRYANDRARDYHVQAFHLGENAPCPSTCSVCQKVCNSALALKNHLRKHTSAYNCEYCGKSFESKSKLNRHITRIHVKSEGYTCGFCNKTIKTLDAYELHIRTIHEGRRDYECESCGRRFTTAAFLRMHQKHYDGRTCKPKQDWKVHYETSVDELGVKRFTCKICNKANMRSIGEHLRSHFPEHHVCAACGATFTRKSAFDRHRRTHEEMVHGCFSCDKTFLSMPKLRQHLAKEHDIGMTQVDATQVPTAGSEEEVVFDVVG